MDLRDILALVSAVCSLLIVPGVVWIIKVEKALLALSIAVENHQREHHHEKASKPYPSARQQGALS